MVDVRQSKRANTTNNQKQAAVEEERMDRRCNKREVCGKRYTIALRGGKVKGRKKY